MKKLFHFTVVLLSAMLMVGKALSQQNTTLIGRYADGPCTAVASRGDTAFFNNGGYFQIVDFTDPFNPVELSKTFADIEYISLEGNYAYVVNSRDGISIIDISDVASPFEVGHTDSLSWSLTMVAVTGNYAYATSYYDGLLIIDVSDPSAPSLVSSIDTIDVYHITLHDNYAYVAALTDGMWIVDISDPLNPFIINHYTDNYVRQTQVAGNYLYVAADNDGLRVMDISDPSQPVEVGYETNIGAKRLAVRGNYTYVEGNGITVVDISNPVFPNTVAHYRGYTGRDLSLGENLMFMADESNGLRIINISNPETLAETGIFTTGDRVERVVLSNSYAYVSGFNGVHILDISDPSFPTYLTSLIIGDHYKCLGVYQNIAYVTFGGLRLFDVSDPADPTQVLKFDNINAYGVAFENSYAYILGYSSMTGGNIYGMWVIDISDPTSVNTTVVGFLDITGSDIAVSDGIAYIAGLGLRVIDVSDPTNPIEVGFIDEYGSSSVVVSGSYAYILTSHYLLRGLRIVDISYPGDPIEVGAFGTGETTPEDLAVNGDYVYLADGQNGLRIIDVSDPANPTEVGFYHTTPSAADLAVKDNLVYVASYTHGLYIIQNDLAEPPEEDIALGVSNVSIRAGDTVLVDFTVEFPTDSSYSSFEIKVGGYFGLADFLELVTDSSLTGLAGWSFEINSTDTLLTIASAGGSDISGEGVLFWLKFTIPDTASGFIPVTIESALFDESEVEISITQGGITVQPLPSYGDVSLDGEIHAYDASLILKYLVESISLNDEQLENANVTLDATVSALDASLILQYVVGMIDSFPYDTSSGLLLASGDIAMVNDEIQASETVVVPLHLSNGENILSFEAVITFIPEHLSYTQVVWSDFLSDFTIETNTVEGQIRIAGASSLPNGEEGEFAQLVFTVRDDFDEDETIVSLHRLRWNEERAQENVAVAILTNVLAINGGDYRIPKKFVLRQNYPNPFNPITTIRYDLPEQSEVSIVIYDIMGRQIKILINEIQEPGYKSVKWDATNIYGHSVGSGLYFYQISAGSLGKAGDFIQTKKVVLIK